MENFSAGEFGPRVLLLLLRERPGQIYQHADRGDLRHQGLAKSEFDGHAGGTVRGGRVCSRLIDRLSHGLHREENRNPRDQPSLRMPGDAQASAAGGRYDGRPP